MPGLFERIADAVYREYDRRVKRASLITEYGVAHHHHEDHDDGDDDTAIMNLPPGTAVSVVSTVSAEAHDDPLEIEPLEEDTPQVEASADAIEADIVNAPPGAPLSRE